MFVKVAVVLVQGNLVNALFFPWASYPIRALPLTRTVAVASDSSSVQICEVVKVVHLREPHLLLCHEVKAQFFVLVFL